MLPGSPLSPGDRWSWPPSSCGEEPAWGWWDIEAVDMDPDNF